MATFEITGFQIGDEAPFGDPGTLAISLPDNEATTLSYTVLVNDGFLPEVMLNLPASAVVYIEGVGYSDPAAFVDAYLGFVTWGASNYTEVLNIDYLVPGTSDYRDYFFVIGGDPFPEFANRAEFETFGDTQLTGLGEITTGPNQADTTIDFTNYSITTQVDGLELTGDSGANLLIGGYDDDELIGLDGDDTIEGGDGDDLGVGGKGQDTLIGGDGDDMLFGNRNPDLLEGGAGDDTLEGGADADVLDGGAGRDLVKGGTRRDFIEGGNSADKLLGNAGRDTMLGGTGDDTLSGGADKDILVGEKGDDELQGGTRADVFVFFDGDGQDTITDFNVNEAEEMIVFADDIAFDTFADVLAASNQVGADVLIDVSQSDTILLENVDIDDLTDLHFAFDLSLNA